MLGQCSHGHTEQATQRAGLGQPRQEQAEDTLSLLSLRLPHGLKLNTLVLPLPRA